MLKELNLIIHKYTNNEIMTLQRAVLFSAAKIVSNIYTTFILLLHNNHTVRSLDSSSLRICSSRPVVSPSASSAIVSLNHAK